MFEVYAIILAAGASTRMKTQKLLLPFKGKTIIENVVENALRVTENIVVVLGSHNREIEFQLKNLPLKLCLNENFHQGMLSSVICGFNMLPSNAQAVMVFLGDQPRISPTVTTALLNAWKTSGKGIVIPTHNGKRGHPILIETRYKNEILGLNPEKGLRELIFLFENDVHEFECGRDTILHDIDTPEEYLIEINKTN